MGSNHSCQSFRGGFIGSGCNPETGAHDDTPPAKPKPPPVKPYVKPTTSLGLQGAQTNQFNTANMGGRMNIDPHY